MECVKLSRLLDASVINHDHSIGSAKGLAKAALLDLQPHINWLKSELVYVLCLIASRGGLMVSATGKWHALLLRV